MISGRSTRVDTPAREKTKFDDVAGLKSAKRDLAEIVDFLKSPQDFRRLGGKVPRGVLLVGPPGTGKTLLARAVAGEAGVPFFSVSASEFIELFVGVGAKRVRDLFEQAKQVSPAIVFFDEIDAVGRSRGTGLGGGSDEREQTLNQLLSAMDGFSRNDLVIVLAATNRPDVLDPALLRPGRFDRRVVVDRPELGARKAILAVHTRDKPLAPDVDLGLVASMTAGFSGADLANLANEAALGATRRKVNAIEASDFSAAYDKIVLGDPRETKLDGNEKRRVAVHESGHAVTAHFAQYAEPPSRVSIIPRGMALGVTMQAPGVDRHLLTQPELEARLRVLMGGYAAESIVLGTVSSGAQDDLRKATELAFEMVAHYGMSERLGPVFHEHRTTHPFLGQQLAVEGSTSDATVHIIEEETRLLLTGALTATKTLLTSSSPRARHAGGRPHRARDDRARRAGPLSRQEPRARVDPACERRHAGFHRPADAVAALFACCAPADPLTELARRRRRPCTSEGREHRPNSRAPCTTNPSHRPGVDRRGARLARRPPRRPGRRHRRRGRGRQPRLLPCERPSRLGGHARGRVRSHAAPSPSSDPRGS